MGLDVVNGFVFLLLQVLYEHYKNRVFDNIREVPSMEAMLVFQALRIVLIGSMALAPDETRRRWLACSRP